jgi:hypothetical protein
MRKGEGFSFSQSTQFNEQSPKVKNQDSTLTLDSKERGEKGGGF